MCPFLTAQGFPLALCLFYALYIFFSCLSNHYFITFSGRFFNKLILFLIIADSCLVFNRIFTDDWVIFLEFFYIKSIVRVNMKVIFSYLVL